MEITTTIIIPNYNGLKFMDECIRSLNAQTYPNFRTLVVDNGSTDGSVEWLKEHQIDTIFLPENTGFSGAVNVGIKAADTPYVLLLNNDVRVDEYFVAEMVRAIGQSERIFSVSSRMIQMYHPDRLDDAGDMYSLLGWAYQRGVGRDLTHYRRSSQRRYYQHSGLHRMPRCCRQPRWKQWKMRRSSQPESQRRGRQR